MKAEPSRFNHLPKAPPLNIVEPGTKPSTYSLWGTFQIHTITLRMLGAPLCSLPKGNLPPPCSSLTFLLSCLCFLLRSSQGLYVEQLWSRREMASVSVELCALVQFPGSGTDGLGKKRAWRAAWEWHISTDSSGSGDFIAADAFPKVVPCSFS